MSVNNTVELAKRLLELTAIIERYVKKLRELDKNSEEYKATLNNLNKAEREGQKVRDKLADSTDKLNRKTVDGAGANTQAADAMNKFGRASKEAAKEVNSFGNVFGKAFSRERIISTIATVTKFVGVYQILGAVQQAVSAITIDAAREFIKFEAAIARIQAVAGASAEETRSLETAIRDTAGTTVFTLAEVASLTEELLKLGFSAAQAEQSIMVVAQASQALGESANNVAVLLGTTSKEFGLTTAELSGAADILVAAVNRSALSFNSFQTAIQYIGPIARQNGATLSETAAAMAVLANNGFSASRIGTGLRQVFIELGKSGENVIDQLEELSKTGVSLAEALDITDERTAAALSTLALAGPQIREIAASFEDSGRSAYAAAIQTDTWSGQIKLLNSAFNDFQVTIGSVIANSRVLVGLIGLFSTKAKMAALAARALANEYINIDKFGEAVKSVAANYEDTAFAASEARNSAKMLADEMAKTGKSLSRNEVEALGLEILKQAESQYMLAKSTKMTNDMAKEYRKSIDNETKSIADLTTRLFFLNSELNSGIPIKETTRMEYESEKKAIEEVILQLNNERDQRNKLSEEQKKAFEARMKQLKAIREEENRSINEDLRFYYEDGMKSINDYTAAQEDLIKVLEFSGQQEQAEQKRIDLLNERDRQLKILKNTLNAMFGEETVAAEQLEKYNEQIDKTISKDSDFIASAQAFGRVFSDQIKSLNDLIKNNEIDADLAASLRDQYILALKTAFRQVADEAPELREALNNLFIKLTSGIGEGAGDASAPKGKKGFLSSILGDSDIELNDILKGLENALGQITDVVTLNQQIQTENIRNEAEQQKAILQERSDFEEQLLRSRLESQLISQAEYENQLEKLNRRKIQRENALDLKIFQAEQKQELDNSRVDYLSAVAQTIINEVRSGRGFPENLIFGAISAGALTAEYGARVSAINKRKFFPKKFAEGGVVDGPAHSQGGVPFTVQGSGGYEMEGGEYIVNKKSTQKYRALLDKINGESRSTYKFANGGVVRPTESISRQLDYLEAIAAATASTANNVSKPVRAFVASEDLRTDENARRIKQRNSEL